MNPTIVGWVLVDGHGADGTILDHDDFAVRTGGGLRAIDTAERAAAAVFRAQDVAATLDRRVHIIGVTWSDDATAEAALLLESLTGGGFDNVVPVRSTQAAETLARGLAPVIGYDKTAVCVIEGDTTTVVMVSVSGEMTRTAVKHVGGGADGLICWLTTTFDRRSWQPRGVVVVGSDAELDSISWRLEDALPIPVFAQNAAHLALARGAALASAQSTEFTDASVIESSPSDPTQGSRPPSYAGALTVLIAGALTFVTSLSLAVGLRVIPDKGLQPVDRVAHSSPTPHIAQAPAPPPIQVLTPIVQAQPTVHAAPPSPQPPVASPTVEPQSLPEPAPAGPPANLPAPLPPPAPAGLPPDQPAPPPPPNPHPLLTRVLEHIHGHHDPPPDEPAPGQVPPPNVAPPPP
jgi:nucleotide-binding universal stress UspA family protein